MRQLTFPFLLKFSAFRLTVHREYVYVQTEIIVIAMPLDTFGPDILDLGEEMNEPIPFPALLMAKAAVAGTGFPAECGDKPLVVRPRHQQIHVVVPRYEAFVAHRSQKRPVSQ